MHSLHVPDDSGGASSHLEMHLIRRRGARS